MNIFDFFLHPRGRILSAADATRVHDGNQFLRVINTWRDLCGRVSATLNQGHRRRTPSRLLFTFTFSIPLPPSLDSRVCNSGEYDLVLLTGLIISTGREVADVSTFSHPILASSPRLCHSRLLTSSTVLVFFFFLPGCRPNKVNLS